MLAENGLRLDRDGRRIGPQDRTDDQQGAAQGVHVVGLSILSGSHRELIPEVLRELREAGADVPVVVGGIIPAADAQWLLDAGVARVYTPKDFELTKSIGDIVDLVAEHHGAAATA